MYSGRMDHMLNIHQAFRLAKILAPHIPDDVDVTQITLLEFGGKILKSMIDAGRHDDFFIALDILTGKTAEEVMALGEEKSFLLFMDGLIENEFLSLLKFYKDLVRKYV